MSMLSAQCDELRDAARGQKAMGLFELAQMLKDAADTIWELRGMVHKERAENEKLVIKLNAEHIARQNVEAKNAKLRELVRDVLAHEAIDCERCAYGERCRAHETTCYTAGIIIRKRARELGVDDA